MAPQRRALVVLLPLSIAAGEVATTGGHLPPAHCEPSQEGACRGGAGAGDGAALLQLPAARAKYPEVLTPGGGAPAVLEEDAVEGDVEEAPLSHQEGQRTLQEALELKLRLGEERGGWGRKCPPNRRVNTTTQTIPLVDGPMGGDPFATAWWKSNLPLPEIEKAKAMLRPVDFPPTVDLVSGSTFHAGPGVEVARLMYEVSRANVNFKSVPTEFKGVFWMRGNPATEELVTLQHAPWFENEETLMDIWAPLTWSWPLSSPKKPPSILYQNLPGGAFVQAGSQLLTAPSLSVKFKKKCPWNPYPKVCKCGDARAFANIQLHGFSNAECSVQFGGGLFGPVTELLLNLAGVNVSIPPFGERLLSTEFTLQLPPSVENGEIWRRTTTWGVNNCVFVDWGSYDLVKIIDGQGRPLEPYYSEFAEYIEGVDLMVWTGWANKTVMMEQAANFDRFAPEFFGGKSGCALGVPPGGFDQIR